MKGGSIIRYFDIFAGIGGFRSGLEKAGGFKCVGYYEIDKYLKLAYETLYDTESRCITMTQEKSNQKNYLISNSCFSALSMQISNWMALSSDTNL